MNAIKSIAACARPACATSRFNANPHAGMGKRESGRAASCSSAARRASSNCEVTGVTRGTAPIHAGSGCNPVLFSGVTRVTGRVSAALGGATSWACDRILPGASHTTKQAFKLYVNELFSRPEFEDGLSFEGVYGFGAGSAYPQGRQHNLFCVTTPSSTLCPSQADGGFQFNKEREAMTKVNTQPTPKAATTTAAYIERRQAIETALADALHFIRTDHPGYSLCLATARARRALSLLKQACADAAKNGSAA